MPPKGAELAFRSASRVSGRSREDGMASVYLAEDLKHDRKVAVKVLKPELAAVLGVERFVIEAWRQPLVRRLQEEMPRLGFTPATPADSTSPIVTFATRDGPAVQRTLQAANVTARVSPLRVRFSPSVYNDMKDVERVLEVLS